MEGKYDRQHGSVVRLVSSTVPAVRMIVVHVSHWEGESYHSFNPVVCLQTRIEDQYTRSIRCTYRDGNVPPSDRERREEGWTFAWSTETHHVILLDVGENLLTELDDIFICDNGCAETVYCPWDASEDEVRLADVVARLSRDAKTKAEVSAAKRAAAIAAKAEVSQ